MRAQTTWYISAQAPETKNNANVSGTGTLRSMALLMGGLLMAGQYRRRGAALARLLLN
jgi:hypothetical protein